MHQLCSFLAPKSPYLSEYADGESFDAGRHFSLPLVVTVIVVVVSQLPQLLLLIMCTSTLTTQVTRI